MVGWMDGFTRRRRRRRRWNGDVRQIGRWKECDRLESVSECRLWKRELIKMSILRFYGTFRNNTKRQGALDRLDQSAAVP